MLTHRLAQCYCVLISIGVAAAFPHAQTPTPAERFEVASLKPYKGPPTMISANVEPGGRFVAQQQSLRDLITLAYRVRESQIIGGPAWIGNDRFDLNAKANRELPPFSPTGEIGPLERMLQSLLADRFKFVAHRETRELPIFALVLAKSNGRTGEKLRPSSTDCASMFADRARAGQPGPVVVGDRPTCGMVVSPWSIRIGGGPLSQLTLVLTNMTNRFVVDRTGLTGNYDVDLQWTPQGMRIGKPPGDNPPGPAFAAPSPDANGATLETAIQEQLGLKLDPQRGPVSVLVIERAEQPTPD
jgi:bla regulator protein blaR1